MVPTSMSVLTASASQLFNMSKTQDSTEQIKFLVSCIHNATGGKVHTREPSSAKHHS